MTKPMSTKQKQVSFPALDKCHEGGYRHPPWDMRHGKNAVGFHLKILGLWIWWQGWLEKKTWTCKKLEIMKHDFYLRTLFLLIICFQILHQKIFVSKSQCYLWFSTEFGSYMWHFLFQKTVCSNHIYLCAPWKKVWNRHSQIMVRIANGNVPPRPCTACPYGVGGLAMAQLRRTQHHPSFFQIREILVASVPWGTNNIYCSGGLVHIFLHDSAGNQLPLHAKLKVMGSAVAFQNCRGAASKPVTRQKCCSVESH